MYHTIVFSFMRLREAIDQRNSLGNIVYLADAGQYLSKQMPRIDIKA